MVNSKGKGGEFERAICKELSQWISGGEREDLLWRTAGSGNRANMAEDHPAHAGDIAATHPDGYVLTKPFVAELKHLKDLEMDKIIKGTGQFVGCWEEAKEEADLHDAHPLMIAKQNYRPVLWVMKMEFDCMPSILPTIPVLAAPQIHACAYLLTDILALSPTILEEYHAPDNHRGLALNRRPVE
jgi:hypothetical protein